MAQDQWDQYILATTSPAVAVSVADINRDGMPDVTWWRALSFFDGDTSQTSGLISAPCVFNVTWLCPTVGLPTVTSVGAMPVGTSILGISGLNVVNYDGESWGGGGRGSVVG